MRNVFCRTRLASTTKKNAAPTSLPVVTRTAVIDANAAIQSNIIDCGKLGLDIAQDLAGTQHFQGAANRNPDGTYDQAIISFELRGVEKQLNFYYKDKNWNSWPNNPRWTISSEPSGVDFDNTTGILLVTLTGPKGDEITYAGNPE